MQNGKSKILILGIIILSIIGIILSVFLARRQQEIRSRATAEAVSLIFFPPSLTKNVGETFDITLSASANGNNLTGVDIPLTFDSTILELTNVISANLLNTELLKNINNNNGTFRYVAVTTQNSTLTGNVAIATLQFKAKNPGSAVILFGDTAKVVALGYSGLLNINGNVNGSYTVAAGPTAVPTSQPTTQPPTPTPSKSDGDISGDGKVDLLDFTNWKIDFLKELSGEPSTGHSDLNGDGQTNLLDFTIWKIGYLKYLSS